MNLETRLPTMPPRRLGRLLASTVLAVCLTHCATADPPRIKPMFQEIPIDERRSHVEVSFPAGTSPMGGSLMLLCGATRVAADRGFPYFGIENRAKDAYGKGSFDLVFHEQPPDGAKVVRAGMAARGDEEGAVLDTTSFSSFCREAGAEPQRRDR